jgi:hypothetical protein
LDYFVLIRLGGALGVCSAGEITNVTQAFHPSGRFKLPGALGSAVKLLTATAG